MRLPRAVIPLIVLVPFVCLFGATLANDRMFAMRDAAHFYYPLFDWTTQEWSAGRVPLWNPYENGGLPAVADASSSIFYPGKLLFTLPLGFGLNYKLYVSLHVLLAAAGTYLLARHWQASDLASVVAAVSFALSGSVVFQYCNVVFLVGAAWLPWALWAADVMLVQRSWRAALALGVVLSLMVLGGDPQAAYHTLLLAGAYLLFLGGSTPGIKAASAGWKCFVVRGLLLGLAATTGFLLAAVQTLPSSAAARDSERAAYNSPRNIYEALEFASREKDSPKPADGPTHSIALGLFGKPDPTGHHERVYDFSFAPWRVAEFIWPNVSGRMFPTKRRWLAELMSEGRVWTPTAYMGLLPVLLAMGQLHFRGGEARSRWLSWLLVLFLLASFGYFGLGWLLQWLARETAAWQGQPPPERPWLGDPVGGLYWLMVTLLPKYIYFRYPAKLLIVVSLAVSLLAAKGWDRAFHEESPRLQWVLTWLGRGSLAAAVVVWLALGAVKVGGWTADAALGPFDFAGAKWDVLTALSQTGIVCLCMLALLRRALREAAAHWQVLAALLTAGELTLANAWLIQTGPAELWRSPATTAATVFANRATPTENASNLPPRVYRGRFSGWRPKSFLKEKSRERMVEIDRWERDTLFPKYQMAVRISLVESYGSLKSLDYQVLLDMAKLAGPKQEDGARLPHPVALRLLGTEHLLIPASYRPSFAELLEPAATAAEVWPENASLWRMKRTLPRAWIVHEAVTMPPLANPKDIAAVEARSLEVLFADRRARDFGRVAVIESDRPLRFVSGDPRPANSAASDTCQITHYEPQYVRLEAQLAEPGIVVISDVFAPGWTAAVKTDGDATGSRLAPILRANRVMRGVELPAGKHVLEFRYYPSAFYRGAAISIASWFFCLTALGTAAAWSRRRVAIKR